MMGVVLRGWVSRSVRAPTGLALEVPGVELAGLVIAAAELRSIVPSARVPTEPARTSGTCLTKTAARIIG